MPAGKRKNHPLPDRAAIKKLYVRLLPKYEPILQKICKQIQTLAKQEGIYLTVKSRIKNFDSYCDKVMKLSKLQGPELVQITDLLGVRIVCPFLEDIEQMEQLLAQKFDFLELEHKAEQHSFREFGYDSIHVLIRTKNASKKETLPYSGAVCEIQLRTILQEAWAEVEHELVYKSDIAMPNHTIRRKLASLNASLTLSDLIFQEIRDSQREIRQRGMKLRNDIESISLGNSALQPLQIDDNNQLSINNNGSTPTYLTSKKLEDLMLNALEAHSNENFIKAIELYSSILHLKLGHAIRSMIYNHRGMAWFAIAQYQKGIEDFRKSIEYNRENARAWCNRGLAYRILEKLDSSMEDYNFVIANHPQKYEGYWGRAQTCYEMKLYTQALSDCRKTLELRGDFTPAIELEKIVRRQLF